MKMKRVSNLQKRKERWDIKDDQDWSEFRAQVSQSVGTLDTTSLNNLASSISASILKSLHDNIGLKSSSVRSKPRLLPPALVKEFLYQRQLEKNWKSLNSAHPNSNLHKVEEAERLFLEQKSRTRDLLLLHRRKTKSSIIEKCSGGSLRARKNFWSYVSPSN